MWFDLEVETTGSTHTFSLSSSLNVFYILSAKGRHKIKVDRENSKM